MAAILRAVAWIEDARAAGNGYLTITVTPEALTEVAVRVTKAGPACARSDALAGTRAAAPPGTPLTAEHSWPEARKLVIAQVTARLAAAAGATVAADHDAERAGFPVVPASGPSSLREPNGPGSRSSHHPGHPRSGSRTGWVPGHPGIRAIPAPGSRTGRVPGRLIRAITRAYPGRGGCRLRRAGRNRLYVGPHPPGTSRRSRPGRVGAARSGQSRLCCSLRALLRCVDAALGRCP